MQRSIASFLVLCSVPFLAVSQAQDTTHFQWPNPPFNSSHYLNATFCEYRNTLSADHFHSGVDIGEPDGNPIYPCMDGIVYSFSSSDGDNNYVRVKSPVGGLWKHISYVHVNPRPDLQVGEAVVAGATILGTIVPGQGHVHLTERALVDIENSSGVEINAVRSEGGLYPFTDTWSPVIDRSKILFREVTTNTFVSSGTLFGSIEFIAKVDERNAPGSVGTTQTNNGTYQLGYRLLSADSLTTIYEPPDSGVRFRFDRKPYDDYTDNVFLPDPYSNTGAHYYRLTSGLGAGDLYATRTAYLGAVDVTQFPEGPYILQIFSEDTRGNADTAYIPVGITHADMIPPAFPTLSSVLVDANGAITVSWLPNSDPDLVGYRLEYLSGTIWATVATETTLTAQTTSISFPSPPPFVSSLDSLNTIPLALSAVDTAGNVSARSDVYAVAYPWFTSAAPASVGFRAQRSLLIVDGFDRYGGSGSWSAPTHEFVKLDADLVPPLIPVSSCSNEAVSSGLVDLSPYSSVFWILGDESTADRTFTSTEQGLVKSYLEGGGHFFVSGSEIGWDLGRQHSASEPGDTAFYHNYLKALFAYDGNSSMTAVQGLPGTIFDGITVSIGRTYPEDYPDDVEPVNGSTAAFRYNATRPDASSRLGGVTYSGTFGASVIPAKLVYLSFPFETIATPALRKSVLDPVFQFFDIPTGIVATRQDLPASFALLQNYPNPFNPSTRFTITLPAAGTATLTIFDLLGRSVATLLDGHHDPGTYVVEWNAATFPSGTYFAVAQYGTTRQIRKLLLLK